MSSSTPRETLELMLGHLGFVFQIQEVSRDGQTVYNIQTRDPSRLLGRDGRTLEDLQYLLNRILQGKEDAPLRILIDVENYREKERADFLIQIRAIAERVKQTGKPEKLAPMNSFDRRLVHQAFAEDPDITTKSEEGPARFKQITLAVRKPSV